MKKLTSNKFAYSGWLAAALVIGIVAGTGFQDSMKLGVVDLSRVITESKLQGEARMRVEAAGAVRQGILQYMDTQEVMTKEQCERFRELELEDDKTDADKMEILAIKSAVTEAIKDLAEIQTKLTELTEDERQRLGGYTASKNTTNRLKQEWAQEFETEWQELASDVEGEMITNAQKAAQAVAEREGYTLVFSVTAAIYAANDITEKAIEEANK